MNERRLRNSLSIITTGLVLINTAWAGSSVWTFAPISGYPASVSVNPSETATIKYTVTNQSHKSHTLKMRPIQGISSSGCTSPLGYHQSCILTLAVAGSSLKGDVFGGPILCDQSNPNQCYQPSQANILSIRLTQKPPVQRYTITSSAGSNGTVSPSGSQTVNPGTTLTFTAIPAAGYGVNRWLVDGNLAQMGGAIYQLANVTANHTVTVTFSVATLTPSVSTLGLSVNCPAASTSPECAQKNDALTGAQRKITITNNGSVDATNVVVSESGLPSGTSFSPSSCGTITANGGTCEITVTPGEIASSDSGNALCTTGVQPEGSVNITADGGLSASVATYVLSYGCIYQGGFIYSVDDTTPPTGSIGGKTAAVTDSLHGQTTPPPVGDPNWGGYGINISTAFDENNAQGANDGSANSAAIISRLTPPFQLSNYAAGLCSLLSVDASGASSCTANTCYANWYLPAICELGPLTGAATCTTTNIQQQLFENTLISAATLGLVNNGFYWSSTQSSLSAAFGALNEYFVSGGNSGQAAMTKSNLQGIRCSRALTY